VISDCDGHELIERMCSQKVQRLSSFANTMTAVANLGREFEHFTPVSSIERPWRPLPAAESECVSFRNVRHGLARWCLSGCL
jgi:hypothetical protein